MLKELLARFSSIVFRNWLSLIGLVILLGSIFAFVFLFAMELLSGGSNAYIGILAFLVAPAFFTLGLVFILLGWIAYKWELGRKGHEKARIYFSVDLARPTDRRNLVIFISGTLVFLFLTALGSYETYHFTESVMFCGQTCHSVMEPEFTTYQHSDHARVACVECHIGEGVDWMVKAKLQGTYQVYATLLNKYPRPIPTPIKNLRPARDTCENCHWPERFSGDLDKTYPHHLADEANTPYYLRMSLKLGGSNPRQGAVAGIHWHMSPDVKVEYLPTDESRQEIPWVRVTRTDGSVEEYRTEDYTATPDPKAIRTMDCMDCHNRPAHVYQAPDNLIDHAFSLGRLDSSLPNLKSTVLALLAAEYPERQSAHTAIANRLRADYPKHPRLEETITEVQTLYAHNIFPEMKARWDVYPDNIGHFYWPGCFRCHDEGHVSTTSQRVIPASDCNSCHTILAQGDPAQLTTLDLRGLEFEHPGGPTLGLLCSDCHNGGPMADE